MGFGFNLAMIFIVVPITGFLFLTWLISRKKAIGKLIMIIWIGVIGFVLLIWTANWLTSKKNIDKDDIYGEYVIDRTKFPGREANWQYNHFRFEIRDNDSIYFQLTDGEKIIRTLKGFVRFKENYKTPRIIIDMNEKSHHILNEPPTIYRTTWDFYYVFESPKFYNVFFKQDEWERIEK